MEKITKDDLLLAKSIALKIDSEDLKELLKQIPNEKRVYLLNYIFELIMDMDQKQEGLIIDTEELKKTR